MNFEPTKKDVIAALQNLKGIERPYGDNEGDPINSPGIYSNLSAKDRELVDVAEDTTFRYLRKAGDEGDEPNQRAITELRKSGFDTSLNKGQYDQDRLIGEVKIDDKWTLDVSDASHESIDD
jgi:hypothetical protein